MLAVPMSCGLKLKPAAGEKLRVSGSARMETVYDCVADWLAESVTLMLNVIACAAVSGVPEIVAVLPVLGTS